MINMRQKLQDHPALIEIWLEEADRQLLRTPGADRQKWQRLETIRDFLNWERCTSCRREYRHPHLCREHMLCGLCHHASEPTTPPKGHHP